MESNKTRELRPSKPVVYYPKAKFYNVVATVSRRSKSADSGTIRHISQTVARRRSHSVETRMSEARPARRASRSRSVDINQQHVAARRTKRSQTIDGRNDGAIPQQDPNMVAVNYLAQSQALLTAEVIKMKDQLGTQKKKIESLTKQNDANQDLMDKMQMEVEEKNVQLACLQKQLESALQKLGN